MSYMVAPKNGRPALGIARNSHSLIHLSPCSRESNCGPRVRSKVERGNSKIIALKAEREAATGLDPVKALQKKKKQQILKKSHEEVLETIDISLSTERGKQKESAEQKKRRRESRAWRVVLHNDDIHTFQYVTDSITQAAPMISQAKAFSITVTAHSEAKASVCTCWKDRANIICEDLQSKGLSVSVEPTNKRKDNGTGSDDNSDEDDEDDSGEGPQGDDNDSDADSPSDDTGK